MKLNANLSLSATVSASESSRVRSPETGVDRMMLERDGDEKVSRATTIVSFQPGSSFSAHVHGGGEEFFVLKGTFSDGSGDFGSGFYVRNPVGSSHAPWSKEGTEIFVKLGQIDSQDKAFVRLDTNGADWQRHPNLGLKSLTLHQFGAEMVRLITLEAGSTCPEHSFPGGAEIFVIKGSLEASDLQLESRDWLRSPAGAELGISSKSGATFYFKTGHLMVPKP